MDGQSSSFCVTKMVVHRETFKCGEKLYIVKIMNLFWNVMRFFSKTSVMKKFEEAIQKMHGTYVKQLTCNPEKPGRCHQNEIFRKG